MLRFMNRANALTLLGAACALVGALLAINGRVSFGLVALAVAGLCDLFDGVLARSLVRTPLEERFGQRLDSLCDAVSFGACGALILYGGGLRHPAELTLVVAFALAAIWRLAYFDAVGMEPANPEGEDQPSDAAAPRFVGLPSTYVALALPLAGLAGLHSPAALHWAFLGTGAAVALAMVSPIRIPKPGRKTYPLFLLLALGLGTIHVLAGLGIL
ncbi:MAG: CDP-alcohol phosphatidyltransferase family protein [Planctomycetes bacterium]|nr:CDP-alcohol phosphatidyltransferase family protein [Planctomycetota bacterium]